MLDRHFSEEKINSRHIFMFLLNIISASWYAWWLYWVLPLLVPLWKFCVAIFDNHARRHGGATQIQSCLNCAIINFLNYKNSNIQLQSQFRRDRPPNTIKNASKTAILSLSLPLAFHIQQLEFHDVRTWANMSRFQVWVLMFTFMFWQTIYVALIWRRGFIVLH